MLSETLLQLRKRGHRLCRKYGLAASNGIRGLERLDPFMELASRSFEMQFDHPQKCEHANGYEAARTVTISRFRTRTPEPRRYAAYESHHGE